MPIYKDESLDRLAAFGNVAQFVSFDPNLHLRYSRIANQISNEKLEDPTAAVGLLLSASPERMVNVRSFKPESPQGNEFLYGLTRVDAVMDHLRRLAYAGFFTIVNETVDVNDGGVSGVIQGSVIEFAPGGTPRVVDNARPASLPIAEGTKLLEYVYGFTPELKFPDHYRVEFSIHPVRRGWRKTHTILWELEELDYDAIAPAVKWPNDFSELVGDKVFGLLVASAAGFSVPRTLVLSRKLLPFAFGELTASDVKWMRTCPRRPRPGRYSTIRGWTDPFKVLSSEDPDGTELSSIIVQNEVPPKYSGALLTSVGGEPIIEAVAGFGASFMMGDVGPTELPQDVQTCVRDLHDILWHDLGSIRLEWVYDGSKVWVLQLQQEAAKSSGTIIVSGEINKEVEFDASLGLEKLRSLVISLPPQCGIVVVGNIGMTSHMADILRRAEIPSRLVRN